MALTENFILPSKEELTVQEISIGTPCLKAGAYYFGKYCEEPSKEFMLCKTEEMDPRKCLNEGKEVTSCALDFFQKVKGSCRETFEAYAHCIEYSSGNMNLTKCRKTQAAYDLCMLEKMGIDRPILGYYATPKVHTTSRPKPEQFPRKEYEPIPELPADFPRDLPEGGARFLG